MTLRIVVQNRDLPNRNQLSVAQQPSLQQMPWLTASVLP